MRPAAGRMFAAALALYPGDTPPAMAVATSSLIGNGVAAPVTTRGHIKPW